MPRPAIIAAVLVAGSALAGPAWSETRCGWLQNPTPGNYFLVDSENSWMASAQGGFQARGFDKVPDISEREYVRTNGNYGYTCACMNVTVDRQARRITSIESVSQKRLEDCRRDPKLPKPN